MNFDRLMKSNNPLIKEETVSGSSPITRTGSGTMTIAGGINKSLMLFGILLVVGAYAFMNPHPYMMMGGVIAGMVISFLNSRDLSRSAIYAPLFAAAYGLFAGALTAMYAAAYSGIIFHAVTITLSIFFSMLFLYKSGLITVTDKFRSIVMTLVGGIMLLYLVSFGMYLFGYDMPFLHDQTPIGIGISIVISIVASMKLLVDFDNFDRGEKSGSPEYMEWYISKGLLFTTIWLYSEILFIVSNFMGGE